MKNKIAIIGATGNVGRKIIEIFLERGSVEKEQLLLFASSASAGKTLKIGNHTFEVNDAEKCPFDDCSQVLLATNSEISKKYVPLAIQAGCTVIDSSSAFRLNPQVPLIVPPVNAHLISQECPLYAIANCLASPIATVLKPLHDNFQATRVTATTYQSTSGAGKEPMDELYDQSELVLEQHLNVSSKYFPRQIAFNVVPQIDKILEDGFTYEEFKIIHEIQKVVSSEIKVLATAVRVPVRIGHSISLTIEFEKNFTIEPLQEILRESKGVALSENDYSTPIEVVGQDLVFVGRIRKDPTVQNGVVLWLVSDNLRRGAALDAVEVAEAFCLDLKKV